MPQCTCQAGFPMWWGEATPGLLVQSPPIMSPREYLESGSVCAQLPILWLHYLAPPQIVQRLGSCCPPARGFRVIGVEADATLLARTFRFAQAHNTHIQLITAKVEHSMLQENVADLVSG